MSGFMARQGDVLVFTADAPEALAAYRRVRRVAGRVILAEGEATGHAHAIADRGCVLYEEPGLEDRFLQVLADGGVDLVHEEHQTIHLPPGDYVVRRQREYSPGELPRRVAD